MKIGYIRTSTIDQNLDRQKQIMRDNNIELLFSEQESGKDTNRPVLNEMLNSIRTNDEIIIASLDRLSRNYKDLKEIIQIVFSGFRLFCLDAYIPSNGPLDRIFFTSWTNASPVPQSKWVNAPVPPPAPMADTCTVPPCPTNVKVRLARLALRIK